VSANNPLLTVYGPRPPRWWAVCNLCGQTSRPRFQSADDAAAWEHDCFTVDAEDDGKVTVTIEYTVDDPPKITWTGNLVQSRVIEIKNAFADMVTWYRSSFWRAEHPHWQAMVEDEWRKRRERSVKAAMAEVHELVERPFLCPGCKRRRCKTAGGLKTHMRACRWIDRERLAAGEYNAALVPGGTVNTDSG
jgi:hypothetical protein